MNILHKACASSEDLGDLKNMEVTQVADIRETDGEEGIMIDFIGKKGEKVSIIIMDGSEIHRTVTRHPIFSAQDLKVFEGYTIKNVNGSDDTDTEFNVTLENESGHTATLVIDGLILDGESLYIEK